MLAGFTAISLGSAGPVLALLAVLSVVSFAVLVARLLDLRFVGPDRTTHKAAIEALDAGDWDVATDRFAAGRAPADRVGRRAAGLIRDGLPAKVIETDLMQAGNVEVNRMGRGLRLLELVGMISPLLGLLGTVLGMIQSFRSLELAEGSANASILAGGIWQALLTTAAGLIVAIPALVGASILAGRVESGAQEIEKVIAQVGIVAARRAASAPESERCA